jgi:hypothetical protein
VTPGPEAGESTWSVECRTARSRAYVLVIALVMALLPSVDETPKIDARKTLDS